MALVRAARRGIIWSRVGYSGAGVGIGAAAMADSGTVRRLCVMAEIERYRENDRRIQGDLLRRMNDVLDGALEAAGVTPARASRQDQGDGRQLIVLPAGLSAATVVPVLVRGLLARLDHDRRLSRPGPLRLCVSIVHDAVTWARHRYAGRATVLAARLMDSPAGYGELQAQPAALLALIVADDLYQDVFGHDPRAWAAGGSHRVSVDLPDQDWHAEAWVSAWAPGALKPPPSRAAGKLRGAGRAVAGAFPDALADMLGPDTGSDLEDMQHAEETQHAEEPQHEAPESHDTLLDVAEYAVQDHDYIEYAPDYGYGEEYADDVEYVTDYQADSSADSPDEV